MKAKLVFLAMMAMILFFGGAVEANAGQVFLHDRNSDVVIYTEPGDPPPGMVSWVVDETNHLYRQWFWYRVGGEGPEHPISDLTWVGEIVSDGDWDPGNERLVVRYQSPDDTFELETDYTLIGGDPGSRVSDIGEFITISNKTLDQPLDFHFFEYVDLDLMGTLNDDWLQILGGNTARQEEGSLSVSETVDTPKPSRLQVDYYPNIVGFLDDGDADDLNNNAGPLVDGDLTWAFQWDVTIAPGNTFIISKDKHLSFIPEPGVYFLLVGGLIWAAIARRRRR